MKQEVVPNLVVEIDDDQILTMRVDLKRITCKSVAHGNPMACSTRTHRPLMEMVNGDLRPSGWLVTVNVFRKDNDNEGN